MELLPLDLGDRILWADGTLTVTPDRVIDFIFKLRGSLDKLTVTEITPEISTYNALTDRPLSTKSSVPEGLFPPGWNLPERYKYLDLDEYLIELGNKIERDDLYDERVKRLSHEIWLYREIRLDDVLRALIYVVETMRSKRAVWGVGRGSSCSSYLLYLLGLHDVDPVRYEIEIADFLRPKERNHA